MNIVGNVGYMEALIRRGNESYRIRVGCHFETNNKSIVCIFIENAITLINSVIILCSIY